MALAASRSWVFLVLGFALAACGTDPGRGFPDVGRPSTDGAVVDDLVDGSRPSDDAAPGFDAAPGDDAIDDPSTPPDVARDVARDVGPLPPTIDVIVPGAPSDAPAHFGGGDDPSRAPQLVYPSDGTIVPHNLHGLEVHFRPGAGTDLFEVSFRGVSSVVRVYTGCAAVGGGCVLTLDDTTFQSVADVSSSDGQVTVMVRATASAGGGVGTSATRTLGVTASDLRGGIYYWSAAAGNINRYEFGLPGAHPETYVLGGNPFACVGCHILSRDGQRIAVGHFIPGPSQMQTLDVATRGNVGAGYGANFGTFSPDSARLLISDGARMNLLDTAAGTVTAGLTANTPGSMPDWSADGHHVVYALPATSVPIGGPGHGGAADLNLLDWDGAAFGAPHTLLHSTGENNYYPSYSPDNGWVLFNRVSGDSYNNIAAQLFAIDAAGASAPIHLAAADDAGQLGNSWPKWAPFVDTYQGEPILWFTFASRRDYGLRLQQQGTAADMRITQLWMAAFRPGHASSDPSVAAFWLPFQSLSEGNHIAQWTQVVRRASCHSNADCQANEICQTIAAAGVCVGR